MRGMLPQSWCGHRSPCGPCPGGSVPTWLPQRNALCMTAVHPFLFKRKRLHRSCPDDVSALLAAKKGRSHPPSEQQSGDSQPGLPTRHRGSRKQAKPWRRAHPPSSSGAESDPAPQASGQPRTGGLRLQALGLGEPSPPGLAHTHTHTTHTLSAHSHTHTQPPTYTPGHTGTLTLSAHTHTHMHSPSHTHTTHTPSHGHRHFHTPSTHFHTHTYTLIPHSPTHRDTHSADTHTHTHSHTRTHSAHTHTCMHCSPPPPIPTLQKRVGNTTSHPQPHPVKRCGLQVARAAGPRQDRLL